MIGTDGNNCIDSTTIAVVVNNLPIVSVSADTLVCENEDLMLSENGGQATSWNWSNTNGFTSTNQNPIINAGNVNSGVYQVIGTDGNNCSDTTTINITAALGQAFVSNLLIPQAGCTGDTLHFIEISQTNLTPSSILWDFGDGTTSTDRDPTHIYATAGNYTIKVTVSDQDCENVSIEKTIIINTCRLGNSPSTGGMIVNSNIAPNPARGQFRLELELNEADNVIMELYNLNGERIEQITIDNQRFINQYFEPQQKGIYFLKIRTVNIPDVIVKKIVVLD